MTIPDHWQGRRDSQPAPGPARDASWLLSGGRVVMTNGVLSPGWIIVTGNTICAVGPRNGAGQRMPGALVVDLRGHWVLPGFATCTRTAVAARRSPRKTSDDARRAAQFHRGHGSTTMLASLVTAPGAQLQARAAMLAGLAADGIIAGIHVAGIHVEGSFLSPGPARHPPVQRRVAIAPQSAGRG